MDKTQTYLAICPNYWGRGDSPEAAKAQMKREGGKLTQYVVYVMPDGAEKPFVDDMGRLRWTWAEGADRSKQAEVVQKRGV